MVDMGASALSAALGVLASTGVEWSTGDYGLEADTTAVIVPISVQLDFNRAYLRAGTQYATIDGPADVFLLNGSAQAVRRATGAAATTSERSGFGDLALTGGYGWAPASAPGWLFDASLGVELPTGDEDDGFGTGGVDYFAGLDVIYDADTVVWSATLGYEVIDDPDGLDFEDPLSFGVSAIRRLGGDASLGLALDARQAVIAGADESLDLTAYAGRPITDTVSIGVHASTGFTDSSADFGAGITLSWSP